MFPSSEAPSTLPSFLHQNAFSTPSSTSFRVQQEPSFKSSDSWFLGAFTASTRERTKARAGMDCWCCNQPDPDICHVFAKEDTQVSINSVLWLGIRRDSSTLSYEVLITGKFDLALDPGYVFFPSDIQYFIDFELADQHRRAEGLEEGMVLERRVPTNSEYYSHQRQAGLVPDNDGGGLYRRVFLWSFIFGGWSEEAVLDHLGTDKQWHGAPMASFRRAFAALGSVRVYVLDKSIRDQLHQLRDLYFDDNNIISAALKKQYTVSKRPNSEPEDDPNRSPKRPRLSTPDPDNKDETHLVGFPSSGQLRLQSTTTVGRKASFATLQAMDVVPQLALCIEWLDGLSAAAGEGFHAFGFTENQGVISCFVLVLYEPQFAFISTALEGFSSFKEAGHVFTDM
ncbi:hypothetical protein N7486_002211 [Penicillium sp. IBT 16267x]|nr:hypothetical protein N7486_002211 [Penicillium sp. IBT 16267x]